MITVIHGDDIVSSRNYYKSLQVKQSETFDGEKLTLAALQEALQSTGLFGNEKQIYIENFFSKKKASKEMDAIIAEINASSEQTTIIFWEGKEIGKKVSDKLMHAHIKVFTIPKSLFSFLDSLKPKNTRPILTLYHQTLAHTESEMILVMLIRQIRLLLALCDEDSFDSIEEVKRMAPWQRKKLVSQSHLFSQETLLALHSRLFDIEVKSKTGGLTLPLPQTIDFFLSTI
jgi:DNA polymerase III delta subunit